jgi:HrpA-like RNA helicase
LDDTDAADCADRFEDDDDEQPKNRQEDDEFELRDDPLSTKQAAVNRRKVPLYCLPLYSMMPSFLQRRVFEPIPEGQR